MKTMSEDYQLMRRFATDGSESAFAEIVSRYLPLVYSAALRQTAGDTHLSQDVAQLVFTDLARKAPALSENVVLPGWLHRATIFAARQVLRGEQRRKMREQQAVSMNIITPEPEYGEWREIRPLLDEALDHLNKTDRDILLLRFFEQQSLAQIGAAFGSTEDAARKRIARGLEKLRAILQRRGVTTTAAALSTVIPANAVQAVPADLAATLAHGSLAAAKTGTIFSLAKIMSATQLKIGLGVLAIAGVAASLVVTHQMLLERHVISPSQSNSAVRGGTIDFNGVAFNQALDIYDQLCIAARIKVDAAKSVRSVRAPLKIHATNLTNLEAIHLLEKAFHDQAGIEVAYKTTNEVVLSQKDPGQEVRPPRNFFPKP